jgi:hypothetical protein
MRNVVVWLEGILCRTLGRGDWARDFYGWQDSAVVRGVETASLEVPEEGPELIDNRCTLARGDGGGAVPSGCLSRSRLREQLC